MKNVFLLLVAAGLICFLSAFTGIQGASAGFINAGSYAHALFHASVLSQVVALAYGAVCLAIAFGIYRRRPFAWRAGLVGLVASGLLFVAQVSFSIIEVEPSVPVRLGVIVLSSGVALLVIWQWGKWWYGQRSFFSNDG